MSSDFINFLDDPYMSLAEYVLNDVVGANGVLGLNTIIKTLTDGTGAININWAAMNVVQAHPPLQAMTFVCLHF